MGKPKKPVTGRTDGPPRKSVPELAYARLLVPSRPETFLVRWSKFDLGGPWCVNHPSGNLADLIGRVKSFESMMPLELFGTKKAQLGTDYDVDKIPNSDALERLAFLGFGDETQISALRIGGASRFWGFRRDPEFYGVFWDPLHEIWPSPKKHT